MTPSLSWLRRSFVSYVRPAPPLARDILRRLGNAPDVRVLENHGLEVGADDTAQVGAARGCRETAAPYPSHAATDLASREVARRGSLYPDHIIVLDSGIAEQPTSSPLLVLAGAGVLLRRQASAGAVALARCLDDVTVRIDPGEPIGVLAADDEAALLRGDAEAYCRSMHSA